MDATRARETAQAAVLEGLREGRPLREIEGRVASCRVRGAYEPDLAMLELVVAALDIARAGPEQPLDTSGWPRRFLPEVELRRRHTERERIVYALHAAAALRTGLRPDVLTDTYGWGGASLLPYAVRAAVMTVRAVADGHDLGAVVDEVAAAVRPLAE